MLRWFGASRIARGARSDFSTGHSCCAVCCDLFFVAVHAGGGWRRERLFLRPARTRPAGARRRVGRTPAQAHAHWTGGAGPGVRADIMSGELPQVIFVLGGPGAGKGTQCTKLVEHFGFVHLSAGDCLRTARDSGSADGQLINEYIREGRIVPVDITVKLLKEAMEASGSKKVLVDGFPRNLDNLEGWDRVMGSAADVRFVLFFDCPEEVMVTRLMERGKTSGRVDDNLESIRKRLRTYMDSTMPIVNEFDKKGKVRKVDGNRPVEEVSADVERLMRAEGFA